MRRPDARPRRPPLLAVLAELYASVEERDVGNVERVCAIEARRLPRVVREEAMAVARTPVGGHRAPIRLLTFWRAARVLDGYERHDAEAREQLELDFRSRREARDARIRRRRAPLDRRPRPRGEVRDDAAHPEDQGT